MNTNKWKNYGDTDFWQLGRLVKKHWTAEDTDNKDWLENEFDVIYSMDYYGSDGDDKNIIVAKCYVDITDDWIDKAEVMSYIGMDKIEAEIDKIRYAIGCIDYYGIHEFQPSFPMYDNSYGTVGTIHDWACTTEQAYEWLQGLGVGELVDKYE